MYSRTHNTNKIHQMTDCSDGTPARATLRGSAVYSDYDGTKAIERFDFCYETEGLSVPIGIGLDTTTAAQWRSFVDNVRRGVECSILACDCRGSVGVDHRDGKVAFYAKKGGDDGGDGSISAIFDVERCVDAIEACTVAYEAHAAAARFQVPDDFVSIG
ncbi:hypothetical protein psal_cds_858 [Pandoravirus salinus]|uniref:Uncharacterized protein n=1 Tax=Pandoravirus salinus TaxID=1349410 RepID=S4VW96_9VIRU|nr:hypothetical protein psal_cds_858 [Pandoravirus salinus]AGO84919.1 hypothetical protein psal_cds_858 [Pandoravirus salinus]